MSPTARDLPIPQTADTDDAKDELRRLLRAGRREHHRHPEHAHEQSCQALTTHALEAVSGAGTVAAYVSVGNEPCTRLLLDALHERGTRVLLPVLGPHLARSWAYFRGSEDLEVRSPGRPPEPSGQVLDAEEIGRVDAVIVPALAIDRAGRRLGQGGGWYDRALPLRGAGVPVFAMVFDDELVTGPLPVADHDVAVDAVIAPSAWFLLKGSVFQSGSR